ncbi:hypothetical protein AVDCRST_MAG94-6312 [uncultured Leptolyngbya sp.]|uniref:Uncharacterized protein n=1 Tax=uncultured Leptolyngbya sp. TaxID=332963 RepID=A0A6J4P8F2_9CYAN|nr:hypothetical protein AVDCRST_MAG94-6312 [uncultured Leptolyngbya sp.]
MEWQTRAPLSLLAALRSTMASLNLAGLQTERPDQWLLRRRHPGEKRATGSEPE